MPQHVCKLADLGAASAANAVKIAEDGLGAIYDHFTFNGGCVAVSQLRLVAAPL